MLQTDQFKFQAVMASLGEVYGREISKPLASLYWDALKDLPIEEVQVSAKLWIKNGKRFPRPAELRERLKESVAAEPKPWISPPPMPKWLGLVNVLFLRYLAKRRLEEDFKGDIRIEERRRHCLDLVQFFEGLEAEKDPEATPVEFRRRFHARMAGIADGH